MIRHTISVVVPVYNVENYLDRCIKSILCQSYSDFELILVDDGSDDSSGQICDKYVSRDARVRTYHKTNGGVSSARNYGIDKAVGDYLCFIDSDDWVEPDYLKYFMNCDVEQYGCIIQSFFLDNTINETSQTHILPNKHISTAAELEYFLEYTEGVHNGFLWHRIFKTNIIRDNNIRFPEDITLAEDGIFFLNYILHTCNFLIIDNAGYHYLVRSNSLTSKGNILHLDKYFAMFEGFAKVTDKIVESFNPTMEIRNGLKKYMWRLAYSWIIERSLNSWNDYSECHAFFNTCCKKYRLDAEVLGVPFIYKLIMKLYCRNKTIHNYLGLKFLIWLNKLNDRINSIGKLNKKTMIL